MSRAYGVAQTLLFLALAAVVLLDRGPRLFYSSAVFYAGTVLCVAGLLLIAAAFVWLRKVIRIQPEPRAGGELVTEGVYGLLRHPIYTGIVFVIIGLFLRRPTLALAIAVAIVIAFLFAKTRFEERLLAERYPEYAAYCKRTWGLVPGVR